MKTLNIVMIVKNEERCLEHCLERAKGLADHIIIVDTGSGDRTKEIARHFHADIYDYMWNQDFSAARNFALDQSDADWNLVLDADEYLISGNRSDIEEFLENPRQLGAIEIHNAYQDGKEISYGVNYTTRLLPTGVRFVGKIHEQADSSLPRVPLPLVFDHDGYLQPKKEERNLPLLMNELERNPDDPYFLYQTAAALRNIKREQEALSYFKKFLSCVPDHANYRARGIVSYLYTLMELQKYGDALDLIGQVEASLSSHADFYFACGIFYMKLVLSDTAKYISYLPNIEKCYLRCLDIGEVPQNGGVLGTGSYKAAYNLGVLYEVTGNQKKAVEYYQAAAKSGYRPAAERMKQL